MSFLGNNAGRQIVMPGQISPGAVGYPQLDTTVSTPLLGRNRIINGTCVLAQRASVAISTGVSSYGGPDRYAAGNGGSAGGQFTQSQGSISFGGVSKNAVVHTVNTVVSNLTGANYWTGIYQVIEGINCYDMMGQPAAVSFIFNSNVSGNFAVSLTDGSSSNTFVSTFTAVAGQPIKVTIPILTLPTTLAIPNTVNAGLILRIGGLNTGTYQTSNTNTWLTGNFLSATGTVNWGATIGNFIAVTEVQFESGLTGTNFERRLFAQELLLCQRYFWVQWGSQVMTATGWSNTGISAQWTLPAQMRTTPTVTTNMVPGNFSSSPTVPTTWGLTAIGINYASISSGTMTCSASPWSQTLIGFGAYGMTLNQAVNTLNVGSSLYIQANAEL